MRILKKQKAIWYAVIAAALYALNVPLSKQFLRAVAPSMQAGFLYLGAGVGMGVLLCIRKLCGKQSGAPPLSKCDLPYTVAMVLLDIVAPILLMYGIRLAAAENVSLLNNFEIVATAVIALAVFRERISRRMWGVIALVTFASILLGVEGTDMLSFNLGSVLVLSACLCWGVENNCTRKLSDKDSLEIVLVKGIGSGTGGLLVAFISKEAFPAPMFLIGVMLLGFVAYGLSIYFYIKAQAVLGAAKTSAFYAISPFLGVAFAFILFQTPPSVWFYPAFVCMAVATYLMIKDSSREEE